MDETKELMPGRKGGFGLSQQGHIGYVGQQLALGKSFRWIAATISWEPGTLKQHWWAATEELNTRATQQDILYHAVNQLMAEIGATGEVDSRHETVQTVMNVLHDIDGGVPATQPDAELLKEVVELLSTSRKLAARYTHRNRAFLNALDKIEPMDVAEKIESLIAKIQGRSEHE
jgi:hypothetical protein